jgi:hypothetical protein
MHNRRRRALQGYSDPAAAWREAGTLFLPRDGQRNRHRRSRARGACGRELAVVRAVAPVPVNVLAGAFATVAELAQLGVRRVSIGGALARAACNHHACRRAVTR